jgi:hypothetical protein
MSKRNTTQLFLKCDRCGKEIETSGLDRGKALEWGRAALYREGQPAFLDKDLCPECFKEVEKCLAPHTRIDVQFNVQFDPKKMADAVDKALGIQKKRPDGCTCARINILPTTTSGSVTSWTFKPCPIHPATVTYTNG